MFFLAIHLEGKTMKPSTDPKNSISCQWLMKARGIDIRSINVIVAKVRLLNCVNRKEEKKKDTVRPNLLNLHQIYIKSTPIYILYIKNSSVISEE